MLTERMFCIMFMEGDGSMGRKINGLNSFILTPKQWIEQTNAVGIISEQGRYG